MEPLQGTKNLELKLECDRHAQTIVSHQYTTYPLGISRTFRLDKANLNRACLYITSISPGLLAKDRLNIALKLAAHSELYLTDQSATKVHPMPIPSSKATTNYDVEIGEGATLEFVPEPIILFQDSALEQIITIKCHPTGKLFWSEIIVPGRLARGEYYKFNYYWSRLQVRSWSGELWFTDAMRLEGKLNVFKDSHLFSHSPILGNFTIVLPQTNLHLLSKNLENLSTDVKVVSSILPQSKGLILRATANHTLGLKNYLKYALNYVRHLNAQSV